VLAEAVGAGGAAVGTAYATNPNLDGTQAATIGGSAAALYVLGRVLPQINLLTRR
jgi:hypothetical protein